MRKRSALLAAICGFSLVAVLLGAAEELKMVPLDAAWNPELVRKIVTGEGPVLSIPKECSGKVETYVGALREIERCYPWFASEIRCATEYEGRLVFSIGSENYIQMIWIEKGTTKLWYFCPK